MIIGKELLIDFKYWWSQMVPKLMTMIIYLCSPFFFPELLTKQLTNFLKRKAAKCWVKYGPSFTTRCSALQPFGMVFQLELQEGYRENVLLKLEFVQIPRIYTLLQCFLGDL